MRAIVRYPQPLCLFPLTVALGGRHGEIPFFAKTVYRRSAACEQRFLRSRIATFASPSRPPSSPSKKRQSLNKQPNSPASHRPKTSASQPSIPNPQNEPSDLVSLVRFNDSPATSLTSQRSTIPSLFTLVSSLNQQIPNPEFPHPSAKTIEFIHHSTTNNNINTYKTPSQLSLAPSPHISHLFSKPLLIHKL